jgi:error-prone DNA polymerase
VHTGIAASAHLTALVAEKLKAMGVTFSEALPRTRNGVKVLVGGLIASAQRPPTAKGVAFLALEDEKGLVNVVLHPEVYEASREALKASFVVVEGRVQKRGKGVSVVAGKVVPLEPERE